MPGPRTATISRPERAALVADVVALIEAGRKAAARSVNAVITTTYWLVGRAIVEREQRGANRAAYGEALMQHLAEELSRRYGRGFSRRNLEQMRRFDVTWSMPQTVSAHSSAPPKAQTPSALFDAPTFALPWSHYVRLLSVKNASARAFYETEALRGGWTMRQLSRQVGTQFYERTALSKNKAAMLALMATRRSDKRSRPVWMNTTGRLRSSFRRPRSRPESAVQCSTIESVVQMLFERWRRPMRAVVIGCCVLGPWLFGCSEGAKSPELFPPPTCTLSPDCCADAGESATMHQGSGSVLRLQRTVAAACGRRRGRSRTHSISRAFESRPMAVRTRCVP